MTRGRTSRTASAASSAAESTAQSGEARERATKALSRPRGRNQIAGLRRRAERAEAELEKSQRVIEVQGNVSALLGELLEPRGAKGNIER